MIEIKWLLSPVGSFATVVLFCDGLESAWSRQIKLIQLLWNQFGIMEYDKRQRMMSPRLLLCLQPKRNHGNQMMIKQQTVKHYRTKKQNKPNDEANTFLRSIRYPCCASAFKNSTTNLIAGLCQSLWCGKRLNSNETCCYKCHEKSSFPLNTAVF